MTKKCYITFLIFFLLLNSCFCIVQAVEDVSPPVLHDIWVSPSEINDGEIITIYANVTDDISGMNFVFPVIENESGNQWIQFGGLNYNETSGLWEKEVTLPQYSETGTWIIPYVECGDNVENRIFYEYDLDYVANFTVNSLNSADVSAPVLYDAWVSPTAVNDGENVKIFINATDDISGIQGMVAGALSPSGNQSFFIIVNTYNATSGLWEAENTIPQYAEQGNWTISYISCGDSAGNSKIYHNGIDYNSQFTVNSSPIFLVPEVPFGSLAALLGMVCAICLFATFKRRT